MPEIKDVVVRYTTDTEDLARARRELGLLIGAESDVVAEFKRVNEQLVEQAKLANGGTQAIGAEAQAITKLQGLYNQLADAKKRQVGLVDESGREAINKEVKAIENEITALNKLGTTRKKTNDDETKAVGVLQQAYNRLAAAKSAQLQAGNDSELTSINQTIAALEQQIATMRGLGLETTDVASRGSILEGVFTSVAGVLAGAFAIDQLTQYAQKVISVTAEFQKFRAVLTNSLGSASEADEVLERIQVFAAKTPFSVQELTESFIKLNNQGFKPTAVQLRQLGDLASSTGKPFDQLAEAILDAQTGENERLKEFGIQAKKSGDQVTFTFKGVSKTVQNTAADIQKYILSLGDLQGVSGSMAAISGTLEGQFSNLGDTTDQLFLSIGKKLSPAISEATGRLSQLVAAAGNFVTGGENNRKQAIALAGDLTRLVATYDALAANTKRSKDEQAEFELTAKNIGDALPTAITGFDKLGNAASISSGKVREYINATIGIKGSTVAEALAKQQKAFADADADVVRLKKDLDSIAKNGEVTRTFSNLIAELNQSSAERFDQTGKLSKKTIEEYEAAYKAALNARESAKTVIDDLKGVQTGAKGAADALKDFSSGIDLVGLLSEKLNVFTVFGGLLSNIEAKIKAVKETLPDIIDEKTLRAQEIYVAGLEREQKRLQELGTNYGVLGQVIKQLANIESQRGNMTASELAQSTQQIAGLKIRQLQLESLGKASNTLAGVEAKLAVIQAQRLIANPTEIAQLNQRQQALERLQERLNDAGINTGVTGEIEKKIKYLTETLPELSEAAFKSALVKLDQYNKALEHLTDVSDRIFDPSKVKDFADTVDKVISDAVANREKLLNGVAASLTGQSIQSDDGADSLATLTEQLKKKEITVSQYNARRVALDKKLQNDLRDNELSGIEDELKLVGDDADKRAALEERKNNLLKGKYDEDAENYKSAQARKREIEKAAFDAGVALIEQLGQNRAQDLADQLAASERIESYEIGLAGDSKNAKTAIQKKYAKEQDEIRRQQAEQALKYAIFERTLAISKIAIDTAKGVMSVLSTGGGTAYADYGISAGLLSAFVIATGVAEAALVLSQPIAKYAKGTRFVNGPGDETSDSVPAYLSRGEGVMPARLNRLYDPVLTAIYQEKIPPAWLNELAIGYDPMKLSYPKPHGNNPIIINSGATSQEVLDALASQPRYITTVDENGVATFVEKNGHTVRHLGQRLFPTDGNN